MDVSFVFTFINDGKNYTVNENLAALSHSQVFN